MAALGKTTVTCPGCHEHLALTLRLDGGAEAGPGELVLAVDRSTVVKHLAQHEAAPTDPEDSGHDAPTDDA